MIKKILLTVLIGLFSATSLSAPSISVDSLEDAVALANETKLPILVLFSAEWCGYCTKTKNDIKSNIAKYQDIIIVYIDIDSRPELRKEYKVKKIPDYMLLNSKGEEINRQVGYLSHEKLLAFIK
jgi:thioredoxin-related protein